MCQVAEITILNQTTITGNPSAKKKGTLTYFVFFFFWYIKGTQHMSIKFSKIKINMELQTRARAALGLVALKQFLEPIC